MVSENKTNESKTLRTAIVYDFDGTLARGNIQEHTFLPDMGIPKKKFWADVQDEAKSTDSDEILVYMRKMLEAAEARGKPLKRSALREHGRSLPLFEGVSGWFDRINAHATAIGLSLEHYVVSSGIHEMIEGCEIAESFKHIFASKFIYDKDGVAIWPGIAINYTTKTQFLFRINKGVINNWDNRSVNKWIKMDERPIPFERMIFIGDGDTDIPSMKMVRLQKGHSIAVFDPEAWPKDGSGSEAQEKVFKLISEDRVHFVVPADYRNGSQLDITVKGILGRIVNG
jgi:phosphoserine phosphatase